MNGFALALSWFLGTKSSIALRGLGALLAAAAVVSMPLGAAGEPTAAGGATQQATPRLRAAQGQGNTRAAAGLPAEEEVVGLAIGAHAAVPASTQPAVAQQDVCTPSGPNPVSTWKTIVSTRGVTLCRGYEPPGISKAWVQIVDLNAGAKIRLINEGCQSCPYSDTYRFTDYRYNKRTASDWFDWINRHVDTPEPGRLFSTSNASFFPDTEFNETSPITLPESHHKATFPDGSIYFHHTWGWAFDTCPHKPRFCHDDARWKAPKIALSLADHTAPRQNVRMLPFPKHYRDKDVISLQGLADPDFERLEGDSIVGLTPTFVGEETARRTFVGVNHDIADTVYILNTNEFFTVGDAQSILESFGAVFTMQLDGGASTQLYGPDWNGDGDRDTLVGSYIGREVPDTLAVYLAPLEDPGDVAALAGEWKDVSHAGGFGLWTLTIDADGTVEFFDEIGTCSIGPAPLQNLGDPGFDDECPTRCCWRTVGPTYGTTVPWPEGSCTQTVPLEVRIQAYETTAGEIVLGVNSDWGPNIAFTRTGANPTESPACDPTP
jgi:hypothetical protein